MSVPHTGRLEAEIHGVLFKFDGDRWRSVDRNLARRLTRLSSRLLMTHIDIKELAEKTLHRAGLSDVSRIISAVNDTWKTELPEGAID